MRALIGSSVETGSDDARDDEADRVDMIKIISASAPARQASGARCDVLARLRTDEVWQDSRAHANAVVARASSPWFGYSKTIDRTRSIFKSGAFMRVIRHGMAALCNIGRVGPTVSAYRDHGLEARATQCTGFPNLPERIGRPHPLGPRESLAKPARSDRLSQAH